MVSICMTMKNRSALLDFKFQQLLLQDFDPKKIEVCITDGYSTDGILAVIAKWYRSFYAVQYALSDRSVLPFKIVSNNPACDRNAQVCHQPSFDTVVITDPEVQWTAADELQWIYNTIEKDRRTAIFYPSRCLMEDKNRFFDPKRIPDPKQYMQYKNVNYQSYNATCMAFSKQAFIANRGFDERFALGFANEDDFFYQWWKKSGYPVVKARNEIFHLYHGSQWTPERRQLRKDYSIPLEKELLSKGEAPNQDNPDWMRPEMLKEITVLKE